MAKHYNEGKKKSKRLIEPFEQRFRHTLSIRFPILDFIIEDRFLVLTYEALQGPHPEFLSGRK